MYQLQLQANILRRQLNENIETFVQHVHTVIGNICFQLLCTMCTNGIPHVGIAGEIGSQVTANRHNRLWGRCGISQFELGLFGVDGSKRSFSDTDVTMCNDRIFDLNENAYFRLIFGPQMSVRK